MVSFSVLDLAPIAQGTDAGTALRSTLELARHAEKLGYHRFWLAEHHNMPGIASAATAVVIGHVAGGTNTIRVGAGGIMLPNHAPLIIAEQFGTLDALFPGRVDLGLGRAPGTDMRTTRALRRNLAGDVDNFPDDVAELMGYFRPVVPGQAVQAVPGAGADIEVWLLGSSLYGAQLAGMLGLPYAFASHFAPAALMRAIDVYRQHFRPSERLERPHLMVAANVIAADTDAEARRLLSSLQQMFVSLRTGRPGLLPPPIEGYDARLAPHERAILDDVLSCSFIGAADTVHAGLQAFLARTGADELIITAQIFDPVARLRSYEIAAEVRDRLHKAAR
ncbi:LLM class flavin-dependent oxidoreductase [Nannocystis bainbridge]|uniref:LLM class flavin-dependent oxidoreductase n=1 Tax=Nannocystis bainbridge TaxID=2995303 RepID=A0ABT5DZI6_9BACT|nr:LLM class flavin-dependent oxidoreductase [Nannocystis bainbridge]MDC0719018.1 LLM class flavin-dependent oxidoreductase [Nannocystis bainbridge]